MVSFKFGVGNFLKDCQKVGIDGLIIPDLPLEEFDLHYKSEFEKYGIYNILLACPETEENRWASAVPHAPAPSIVIFFN